MILIGQHHSPFLPRVGFALRLVHADIAVATALRIPGGAHPTPIAPGSALASRCAVPEAVAAPAGVHPADLSACGAAV